MIRKSMHSIVWTFLIVSLAIPLNAQTAQISGEVRDPRAVLAAQ
jgi:hypothetical protein